MIIKLFLAAFFLIVEIALGIYSFLHTDSLMIKFIFFLLTTLIVCILIIQATNIVLPSEENLEK
ncbi:hypothetical protein RBU60_05260 [Mesonia sp. MT50]|uniref:Uncharacterized protein n=1 Tax=Mesonia profundi TaxID=3070998 RepID=A0ABU1A2R1_9FLAO|nr:hypothetical protein [Mesonia profundi]MDQ7916976.1 hypothetical protein [Mesonia profundi]